MEHGTCILVWGFRLNSFWKIYKPKYWYVNQLMLNSFIVIFTLFVHPQDNVQYTLIGMGTGPQYFSIDPRSGSIRIRETLKDDPLKPTNYTVKIWLCSISIFTQKGISIQKYCKKYHRVKRQLVSPMRHLSIIKLVWLILWTNLNLGSFYNNKR